MTTNVSSSLSVSSTPTILHQGFVYKRGEQLFAGWKQRYLVLYSNKKLLYFVDETMKTLKGVIDISPLNENAIQQSSNTASNSSSGLEITYTYIKIQCK